MFLYVFFIRSISTGNPPSEPGRPVALDVKGTSVTLRWTTPSDNGGCVITGYIIKYGVASSSEDPYRHTEHIDQATTSYRFSGKLQTNTSYRFAVAAVNKVGQGPWSEFSDYIETKAGWYLIRLCCVHLLQTSDCMLRIPTSIL